MRRLAAFIVALIILSTTCTAAQLDSGDVVDAVPDSVKEIVGDIDDVSNTQAFLERITSAVKDMLASNFGKILKKAVCVLTVAVLCSVLGVFGNEKTPGFVDLCGCAAITIICVSDVNSYIRLGSETVDEISFFSKTLLPALCTATATCGAISAAAVKYAASALFMDLFISLAQNFILPFIYAYLAVSIASAAFDSKSLAGVASVFKWASTSLMTVLSIVFTAYLSISSSIASSGDAVASRVAKTAISTALPVVGGIISDAASSVVAGAELIKNTMGAFGMITVLAICISPIVVIGLNYLMFKAASAGVAALKTDRLAKLTGNIGSAFGMMLGLVGCCGAMMFISILSCIRVVVG